MATSSSASAGNSTNAETASHRVKPTTDALQGLRKVHLKGRDPRLPRIYRYEGRHPLRPSQSARMCDEHTYVYFIDTTAEGRRRAHELGRNMDIPYGRIHSMNETHAGLLELCEGDWLLARDAQGDGDPNKDIIQAFVIGSLYFDEQILGELRAARDIIMGERKDRDQDVLPFEKHPRAVKVRGSERCYSLGLSVEAPKRTGAPTAANRVRRDFILDDHQLAQKRLVEAVTHASCVAFESQAPENMKRALKQYASVVGMPNVGYEHNYLHPALQLNIAAGKHGDSDGSLVDEMGVSGDKHEDAGDSAFSLSNMMVLSDVEEDGEPGRFHLPGLGVYIQLYPFCSINFSGRLTHGGTAPFGPAGKPSAKWSSRGVVIGYPAGAYVNGVASQAIAVMPYKKDPLYLTPEMVDVNSQEFDNVFSSDRANMAMDGHAIMKPYPHVEWTARALLLMCRNILRQMPPEYRIRFDAGTFLQSITMEESGERRGMDPWDLAPDPPVHAPANEASQEHASLRERAIHELKYVWYPHVARGIPTAQESWPEDGMTIGRQASWVHAGRGESRPSKRKAPSRDDDDDGRSPSKKRKTGKSGGKTRKEQRAPPPTESEDAASDSPSCVRTRPSTRAATSRMRAASNGDRETADHSAEPSPSRMQLRKRKNTRSTDSGSSQRRGKGAQRHADHSSSVGLKAGGRAVQR